MSQRALLSKHVRRGKRPKMQRNEPARAQLPKHGRKNQRLAQLHELARAAV